MLKALDKVLAVIGFMCFGYTCCYVEAIKKWNLPCRNPDFWLVYSIMTVIAGYYVFKALLKDKKKEEKDTSTNY